MATYQNIRLDGKRAMANGLDPAPFPLSMNRPKPVSRPLHVLVLGEELPYPPNSGKRIRTWNLLRRLAPENRVSFLCYGDPANPAKATMEQTGIHVHLVPPRPNFQGLPLYLRLFRNLFSIYPYSVAKHFSKTYQLRIKNLLSREHFDLVHCEWTPYARFHSATHPLPLLITTHNVESQIWYRRAQNARGLFPGLFFTLQALKMEFFERRELRRASLVTATTPRDAERMSRWGVRKVRLVENGVDSEYFQPNYGTNCVVDLLFLGSLDWQPNLDALDYLLERIMPIVHSYRPATRLRAVGRRPARSLASRFARLSWAELVADVPDARAHLAEAAVVVVPLRIGGGSRIKILESLAAGKAVVSTSIGAEGLSLVPGEHIQIADQPSEFARHTVELLTSPEERERLGRNGRSLVTERYGWDRIAGALESAWMEACVPPPLNLSLLRPLQSEGEVP